MRFVLKDYQTEAVARVLRHLDRAREDTHRRGDLVAFALSATTGAGKTVMATAVIEALFKGSDEFEVEADPSAVVLWVTDDPSLNEQTRHRFIESGDRLDVSQLVIIGDGGFDQETFSPGTVYFLNVQKLRADTTYVTRSDRRTYTLWDTIRNTIEDDDLTLYLVLDEAHKGMRSPTSRASEERNRATIVQRLINGHADIPPVPIVWGISATVERFTAAMNAAHQEGRIMYPAVTVDPRAVQASGLLKDVIWLDFPDEKGAFETTFLRSSLREMRESSALWADYARQEGMADAVQPLMVLQVGNKPSDSSLLTYLEVIHEVWPEIGANGVANVFGDHADLSLGPYTVPYIAPQDVQDARHVRVLLAKDAVSTGWDCPRAEVLFSLRPAKDRTHITQLLGRMVRTPLARRIEGDERLNAVSCFLPYFDQPTATDVAKILTGEKVDEGDPDGAGGKATNRKVLTSPVTLLWNAQVPEEVGDVLSALPSKPTPRGRVKPIKRLLSLAATIALDGLMASPDSDALDAIYRELDAQMARHEYTVAAGVEDIRTAEIRRITSRVAEGSFVETTRQERADDRTVEDAFAAARRALSVKVANGYVKRLALRAGDEDDDVDILDAKAKVAALLAIPGVLDAVNAEAERTTRDWLNRLRADIRGLSDDRRAVYDEITLQDREPQMVEIVTPKSRIENTKDSDGNDLPVCPLHLLSDEHGNFPVGSLNDWERDVVETELGRANVVAWYRNPSSATADALQVPYRMGDQWRPLQPDFIFFMRKQDGAYGASIVDPHGDHLSDALPKLRGLADYAEAHGDAFLRIEAVSKVGNELRFLDLTDPRVRSAVGNAASAKALYEGDVAGKYH